MTAIRIPTTDVTDFANQPGQGGPLRPGGQALPTLPNAPRDLPSTLSPAAQRQQPGLTLVHDLWEGAERIRAAGRTYLPQEPKEDAANYRVRLERSAFFNIFAHTVEVLTGFVFRKDPVLGDDVPEVIKSHWENIDNAGTHGDVFLRDRLQDALIAGHAGILVEFPPTGGTQKYQDEQSEGGIRPYWVPIKKNDIFSWRTTVENGQTMLTQLVIREAHYVPDGVFGEKLETCYRVLYRQDGLVGWRLLSISPNKAVVVEDEGLYPTQDEIPFTEVPSSSRRDILDSDPPLADLAYLNVAHYQQWSDYATSIHKTNVPILFTAGFLMQDEHGQEITVGPNSGLNSENPQGTAQYVSHDGAALSASKDALDDLKNEMAVLGVAMLATRKKAPETAEAKRIDRGSFDSALSVTARGLQDATERALDFHAKYLGLPDGGSVEINRDFENMTMQADMLTAFATAVGAGLPERVMLEAMQDGGLISPEEDLDSLVQEVVVNKQAQADQKALELSMTLAAKAKQPQPRRAGAVAS